MAIKLSRKIRANRKDITVPNSVKRVVVVLLVLTFIRFQFSITKPYDNGTEKFVTKYTNVSLTPKDTTTTTRNANSSGTTVSNANEAIVAEFSNSSSVPEITTTTSGTNATKNTNSSGTTISIVDEIETTNENTTTTTLTTVNIVSINANSSETDSTFSSNTQTTNESTTTAFTASMKTAYEDEFGNNGVYNSSEINKDIVIQQRFARSDRLGSHIQRPLFLMSYAHCNRQTFCIAKGREGYATYFPGYEFCPDDLTERLDWGDRGWKDASPMFQAPITKPGVYAFKREDDVLIKWTREHDNCAFDESMRQKWGEMIVGASYTDKISNKTLVQEDLFEETDDPNVVTVAINIRRGDFSSWGLKAILDQFYVGMLRHLRSILEKAGKLPEVHLFSEDYGMIDASRNITRNWTMYDGIVEHFHLAPDLRTKKNIHAMDMDLNLRDWRHFVKADILIVGGTFSRTPALGRPKHPNPKTGLPLTIADMATPDEDGSKTKHSFGWSKYDYGVMPDKYELINLPEVFAKHDTVPVEVFFKDLLADWNATYNSPDSRKQ